MLNFKENFYYVVEWKKGEYQLISVNKKERHQEILRKQLRLMLDPYTICDLIESFNGHLVDKNKVKHLNY